jgi:Fur family transcriptional regulator, ferric uptake regulator
MNAQQAVFAASSTPSRRWAPRMYHPGSMTSPSAPDTQDLVARARTRLRDRGMRWTPQRRALVEVLIASKGHVTGTELVERCLAIDPDTTPSTVYRTLDVLEEIGLVRHSHGHDGREEFHILPTTEHGHLRCEGCGATWEIEAAEARQLTRTLARDRGFSVNLSHLTIVGRCRGCTRA